MKLSVIIVNYNVKFFLEQCLLSVTRAIETARKQEHVECAIIVVDNNSVDGSQKMLKEKFPDIIFIENKKNLGFSAANNQGIQVSDSEYVLLLNPDTLVEEYTFLKCIKFMDQHPEAGALGVKMIDGKGRFLPESKRSLPTPITAFYKIFGLAKLFPKSRIFGKYHLGFLDENKSHEVEILAGAFMMIRRTVLEKTGLLDETFFMYGEDIDLSYRILQAGYKNYYFPETQIIHYKGESTKKSSVNYVFVFYKAMIIFARKHFSRKNASFFSLMLNLAIYFRAGAALAYRFLKKALVPLFDFVILLGLLLLIKKFWENSSFGHGMAYPMEYGRIFLPLYSLLWIFGLFMAKGYIKPYQIRKIFNGVITGTVLITFLYAFLGNEHRYSRALIIFGIFLSFLSFLLVRMLKQYLEYGTCKLGLAQKHKIAIIGEKEEAERVFSLLEKSDVQFKLAGFISPANNGLKSENFLGNLDQIQEILEIHKINELIFCSKDMSSQSIIQLMSAIRDPNLHFKIAPEKSLFVIGSHYKNHEGDFYTIDIGLSISRPDKRFNKRAFDICCALVILIFSPLLFFFQSRKRHFFSNIMQVLQGKKTWVSYSPDELEQHLPRLPSGVLQLVEPSSSAKYNPEKTATINLAYARNYTVFMDLKILCKYIHKLGR
jgi:O-antigen biosynthesis protein